MIPRPMFSTGEWRLDGSHPFIRPYRLCILLILCIPVP